MSDQELLEIVASVSGLNVKSGGITTDFHGDFMGLEVQLYSEELGNHWHMWNPLDDCGDAMRLMSQFEIEPFFSERCGEKFIGAVCPTDGNGNANNDSNKNGYNEQFLSSHDSKTAAMQRAIVLSVFDFHTKKQERQQ